MLTRLFPSINQIASANINLMMTMLIGGLWHGSSWLFVVWGGLNGLGLLVYKIWRKYSPYENSTHWLANTWKIFLTFSFITFTRIWFRGESIQGTTELLSQITHNFGWESVPQMLANYWKAITIMLIGLVVHWLPERIKCMYRDWFIERHMYQKVLIASFVVFIIYQSISSELTPFIYFQF